MDGSLEKKLGDKSKHDPWEEHNKFIKKITGQYENERKNKIEWIDSHIEKPINNKIIVLKKPLFGKRKLPKPRIDLLYRIGEKLYNHIEFDGQYNGLESTNYSNIRNTIRNRNDPIIIYKTDYSRKCNPIIIQGYNRRIKRFAIFGEFNRAIAYTEAGEASVRYGENAITIYYKPLKERTQHAVR